MKTRSTLFLCLAAFVCLVLLASPKANAAKKGIYTYEISNGEATITACKASASGKITIPSVLGDCPVTAIGEEAFAGCERLTAITIPDGVTSIGTGTFLFCFSLTSITIPDGVTSIGDNTFMGCSSLTAITIPDSVTSIGEHAFDQCFALTAITIPNSVTSIGRRAFIECRSLTSITIPDGVTSIGENTFANCTGLTAITIPDSVTSIGDYAFGGCDRLSAITIPDAVTSIDKGAFEYCTSLTAITIPDAVTSIGEHAFEYCTSLTAVTIPEGVTEIFDRAFAGCTGLTSITIPTGISYLAKDAFEGCTGLSNICFTGTQEQWNERFRTNPYFTGATLYSNYKHHAQITKQPKSCSADIGSQVQFSTETEGMVASYQWEYRKGNQWFYTSMEGCNTDTLTAKAIGCRAGCEYRCRITYIDGSVLCSEPAVLTVKSNIEITGQPGDQAVAPGQTAQFTVTATGEGLKYQWQYQRPGSERWMDTQMDGFSTDTLSVAATLNRNGYRYRCRIIGSDGSIADTAAATLTVQ